VLFASLPKFIISAAGWITIFLFGSLVTTYAKAAAFEKLGLKINGGVLERAERLALLLIGILLAAINPAYLTSILAVLAFLTNISAIQRVLSAVKKLKQKKKVLKI
jgi:CDP-diacylglycerol--glycerol-3-phosphate 3-phosphatidyltransferase